MIVKEECSIQGIVTVPKEGVSSKPYVCIAIKSPISDDKGISHILEHLIRREIICKLRDIGEEGVFHREITFPEWTMYYIEVRGGRKSKKIIRLFLEAIFDAQYIYDETVIDKEIISVDTNGICYGRVYNEILARCSSKLHSIEKEIVSKLLEENPYKYNICGDIDKIINVCPDEIQEYYKKIYTISNAKCFCGTRYVSKILQQILRRKNKDTNDYCRESERNKKTIYRVLLQNDVNEEGVHSISYIIGTDNRNRSLWQIAAVNEMIKKKKWQLQKFFRENEYGEYIEVVFRDNICDPYWTFVLYNAKQDLYTIKVDLEKYIFRMIVDYYHEINEFLRAKAKKILTSYEMLYLKCQNNGESSYIEDEGALNEVLAMTMQCFVDSFIFNILSKYKGNSNQHAKKEFLSKKENNICGVNNYDLYFEIIIDNPNRGFWVGILKLYFLDFVKTSPDFGCGYIKNIQVKKISEDNNIIQQIVQISCAIYNKNHILKNDIIDEIMNKIHSIDEEILQICIMKFIHNVDKNIAQLISSAVNWNVMSSTSSYCAFLDQTCGLTFFYHIMNAYNKDIRRMADLCKKAMTITFISDDLKVINENDLNSLDYPLHRSPKKRVAYQHSFSTAALAICCRFDLLMDNIGKYMCVVYYLNQLIMEDIIQNNMGAYSSFCGIYDHNTILFNVSGCNAMGKVLEIFGCLEKKLRNEAVLSRYISQNAGRFREDIVRMKKIYHFSEIEERRIWEQILKFERLDGYEKHKYLASEVAKLDKELQNASYTLIANEAVIKDCKNFFDDVFVIKYV